MMDKNLDLMTKLRVSYERICEAGAYVTKVKELIFDDVSTAVEYPTINWDEMPQDINGMLDQVMLQAFKTKKQAQELSEMVD
ncbi:MAG: hypothetical protein Q8910_00525 [Bacteroidota bacterium]|nr:hypothetical protein [Bacteroidota bacterium]